MIKIYLFIFIFIFLSSCGGDKEIIQNKKQINLFEKNKIINSELNTSLKINLSTFVNNSFLNNNTNNNGNIIFDTEFDKKKIFKFKKIDGYSVFDPELIFTQDGNIIFFDGNGSIFKIDEEMKELWKVNHYSKKQRRLKPKLFFASNKKRLIISDSLSQIYSVNIDNGELIWKKYSDSSFNSNIVLSSDKIMVLDFDNVIRCFSLENGKELWKFKTIDVFIKSEKKLSIILNQETIYFTNNFGDVTALNINDGSLQWQTPTQSNDNLLNSFGLNNSDLIYDKNTIYLSNNKNELFALDANTGIIKWKQNINSSLKPTVSEGYLFTISDEGYLFVIETSSGKILRITDAFKNLKKRHKFKPTGFILAKNKIYLSTNRGLMIKINIINGEIENIFKLHNSKISRSFINNKSIYVIKDNAIARYR